MTPGTDTFSPARFIRHYLPDIGFVAASIIWAAVMIDTGDIAWPLAAWMGTALAPMSLHRRKIQDNRTSTVCAGQGRRPRI